MRGLTPLEREMLEVAATPIHLRPSGEIPDRFRPALEALVSARRLYFVEMIVPGLEDCGYPQISPEGREALRIDTMLRTVLA